VVIHYEIILYIVNVQRFFLKKNWDSKSNENIFLGQQVAFSANGRKCSHH
jgi:hypothetical protein